MCTPSRLIFRKPTDVFVKEFHTFHAPDSLGNPRPRINIALHPESILTTLLSGIIKQTDLNLAKTINCFFYIAPEETIKFLSLAGHDSSGIDKAVKKVHESCTVKHLNSATPLRIKPKWERDLHPRVNYPRFHYHFRSCLQ